MPLTYFSHQAPALVLKLVRPRWFDGTALVIGSMSPDFAYALWSGAPEVDAHVLPALVWFCVPASLVVCLMIRYRVAEVAFAHLPDLGPYRLHDYRVLARRRPPILLTAVSALLGAVTHTVWDGFTHGGRFGVRWLPWLSGQSSVGGRPEYRTDIMQQLSTVVGAVFTVACMLFIARKRLLRAWYGPVVDELGAPLLDTRQRVMFWVVAACGLALGIVAAVPSPHYWVVTLRLTLGLALGVAVASCLPITRPRAPGREAEPVPAGRGGAA